MNMMIIDSKSMQKCTTEILTKLEHVIIVEDEKFPEVDVGQKNLV